MGNYPLTVRPPDDGFLDAVRSRINHDIDLFKVNPISPHRKFLMLKDDEYPEMKNWLADHFQLGEWKHDPYFQNLIAHVSKGGAVHYHTDPSLPDMLHVRINLLVNPGLDCHPILDRKQIEVDSGEAWVNLAGRVWHSTTENRGEPRSIISFGYHVPMKRANELYIQHLAWLNSNGD